MSRDRLSLFIVFDNAVQKSGFCHLEGLQNLLSYKNILNFMNLRINVPLQILELRNQDFLQER